MSQQSLRHTSDD